MKKLDLDGGKYTVIYGEGKQEALRYGEEWRDLTGDNLIYWLLVEIEDLQEQVANIKLGKM